MKTRTYLSAIVLSVSSAITFAAERPYNFIGLTKDQYTIEVTDRRGEKMANLQSGPVGNKIRVEKINNEPSKFMLTVANEGANKINVTIFNEEGDLLLQEERETVGNFALVYTLVKANSYTFIVSDKRGNSNIVQY